MGKIVLILGGAKSGKSHYAQEMAKALDKKRVLFIATCEPSDPEMLKKVRIHRRKRPKEWKTVEEKLDLLKALKENIEGYRIAILDCLTIYLSNLLEAGKKEKEILAVIKRLFGWIKRESEITLIIVSNELGLGIVPELKLGREFRDIQGLANQMAARYSQEVYLIISGIPLRLK